MVGMESQAPAAETANRELRSKWSVQWWCRTRWQRRQGRIGRQWWLWRFGWWRFWRHHIHLRFAPQRHGSSIPLGVRRQRSRGRPHSPSRQQCVFLTNPLSWRRARHFHWRAGNRFLPDFGGSNALSSDTVGEGEEQRRKGAMLIDQQGVTVDQNMAWQHSARGDMWIGDNCRAIPG